MKVFVYSTFILYTPHTETDLELMQLHLDKGDTVYRFVCDGQLSACDVNEKHQLLICLKCQDIRRAGEKLLNGSFYTYPIFQKKNSTLPKELITCKNIEDLKNIYLDNFDIGYGIASSLISSLRNPDFDVKSNMELIKQYYISAASLYLSTIQYINRFKPDIVYLFNGRFGNARAVLRACEATKTQYIAHERGANQHKYDLFYNKFPHDKQYSIQRTEQKWSSEEYTQEEKIKIGSDFYELRRNGTPKDWYSYVNNQVKTLLPENFNASKKNIGIFNSSTDEFAAISKDWSYTFFENQEEFIGKLMDAFKNKTDYHFYLRVHPNLKNIKNSQTQRIGQLNFPNLTVIPADSPIGSYALLDHCDKAITFGSTMGVEATFWGKASILVAQGFYSDACTYTANSFDQVTSLICSDLKPKEKIEAIKYGYFHSVKGIEFKYFKASGLFSGTFKGHDLMKEESAFTSILHKIWKTKVIGKPIAIYANAFQKQKLPLPAYKKYNK